MIKECKEFFKDSGIGIHMVFHKFRNTRSFSRIQIFKELFMDLGKQRVFYGFRNIKSFPWIQEYREFFKDSEIQRVF